MPGVTHPAMAGLTGALVGPRLEEQSPVPPAPVLLLREVPLVLGGHLGSQPGTLVLGVLLGLAGQRVQAQGHLGCTGGVLIK